MLVRTRLDWARLVLRRSRPADADQARQLANAALDLAHERGTPELVKQAAELIAATVESRA